MYYYLKLDRHQNRMNHTQVKNVNTNKYHHHIYEFYYFYRFIQFKNHSSKLSKSFLVYSYPETLLFVILIQGKMLSPDQPFSHQTQEFLLLLRRLRKEELSKLVHLAQRILEVPSIQQFVVVRSFAWVKV